jgi:hypothetical protein
MHRTVASVVIVVCIAAIAGGGWWYHYISTPQYSLGLLAKAVKDKDYETARYFVDDERLSDTISKSLVDAVTSQFNEQAKYDSNPYSGLGIAMMQMMTPRLREMAKDQIKEAIKQGLSGNDTLTDKNGKKQVDLKIFSNLQIQQCVISGNTAEVLLVGVPQPNVFELKEIHLRMAKIPNSRNWRITETPDIGQAFARILDERSLKNADQR